MISRAIKAAIDHHIERANTLLKKALAQYPSHSILHYNLALTYALMGDYRSAHQHFLRSYHLQTDNYLSAIFALMCESITNQKIPQVEQFVADDLGRIVNPDTLQLFYQSLFYFYRGNYSSAMKWLEAKHDSRPMYLLLDILVSAAVNRWNDTGAYARKLRNRMPKDVLANLVYLHVIYRDLPPKRFSARAQQYLKTHPMDLGGVYYGSAFTRNRYIALRFLTGTLYPFKKRLEAKLLVEKRNPVGILEALALSDILLKEYEEAYVHMNELVDKYHRQDSRTLFLAAVAAIGAGHAANATALLELAKLTDPDNYESRYALGLLYLEQENLTMAAIHFSKIPNGTFKSRYFDFDIISKHIKK
jgi:predicted Zn-dependent protease